MPIFQGEISFIFTLKCLLASIIYLISLINLKTKTDHHFLQLLKEITDRRKISPILYEKDLQLKSTRCSARLSYIFADTHSLFALLSASFLSCKALS